MLKFLADESCDFAIVRGLRANGFDVSAVVEDMPGVQDSAVLKVAVNENRILLTEDKDFGEWVSELKKADIQAALLYASASIDHTEVRLVHA